MNLFSHLKSNHILIMLVCLLITSSLILVYTTGQNMHLLFAAIGVILFITDFIRYREDSAIYHQLAHIAERSGRDQDKDDGGGLETLRKDGYM